jgi:hypothetical protein
MTQASLLVRFAACRLLAPKARPASESRSTPESHEARPVREEARRNDGRGAHQSQKTIWANRPLAHKTSTYATHLVPISATGKAAQDAWADGGNEVATDALRAQMVSP